MIVVCTPTRGELRAEAVFDLWYMKDRDPSLVFITELGTLLPNQRTLLVRGALSLGASHVLWIDSDMRFPPDTPERLLRHNLPIVGANCRHRQAEHEWTAGRSSVKKHGAQEVDQLGFGVTLVSAEVFETIIEPWFATPFDGEKFVGEDVFFCRKAREAGFSVYVDHDLSHDVKHIGTTEF